MKHRVLAAAAAALVVSSTAGAQLELRWAGGLVGTGVDFDLEGPPGAIYALLPSLLPGPTPLALIDPSDPRVLSVGLDQPVHWRFGFLTGAGNPAHQDFGLPNDPSLAGQVLYAQGVTFTLPLTSIDLVSNPVAFRASLPGQNHRTLNAAFEARGAHTATTLRDGRVWIAGGLVGGTPTDTWELFDPRTQSFVATGLLPEARFHHTASLLPDGRVLVFGGAGAAGGALATSVLFDPTTDTATAGATAPMARVHHTANVLLDGRVLVVGGATQTSVGKPFGYPASFAAAASPVFLMYGPGDAWTTPALLPQPLIGHRTALVPDGRVVITGGVRLGPGSQTTAATWIYDPVANSVGAATPLPQPTAFHLITETADGRVLVASGSQVFPTVPAAVGTTATYLFDLPGGAPGTSGTWSLGPPTAGIIQCGDIKCIPGGNWPPHQPGPINPFDWIVVYAAGVGFASVDLAAGTGVPNTRMLELDAAFTAWIDRGSTLAVREGGRMAVVDEGLRVLFSGGGFVPGSGPDDHGELRVRAD